MAEIGAEPVTVRKSTPSRPTAFLRSFGTSVRCETSRLSASSVDTAPASPDPACSVVSDMQPASCQGRLWAVLVAGATGRVGRDDERAIRLLGTRHVQWRTA